MFGSVLAPFINFHSQHIYTARALFIPTLFYVFFTLSTSRLYQIELVHQVETLKRIYVLETKDLVSLLDISGGVSTHWVSPHTERGCEKCERENCMRNYKRSINLISHIMHVSAMFP